MRRELIDDKFMFIWKDFLLLMIWFWGVFEIRLEVLRGWLLLDDRLVLFVFIVWNF